VNAYGASKLCGEAYTRAFFLTYRFPTVVVRPFNTYGPRCHHEGLSGEVIPKFLLRALAGKELVVFGDGLQTRDFIHVSDTARGIVLAGTVNDAVGETLNLGTGRETTILDLGRLVGEVAGRAVVEMRHDEPRPGNTPRLCADAARARGHLGFIPRVSLEEGLEALRDWYLSQAESPHQLLAAEVVRCWEEGSVHAAHE
jgi:UDP-glucose 4-epimerase